MDEFFLSKHIIWPPEEIPTVDKIFHEIGINFYYFIFGNECLIPIEIYIDKLHFLDICILRTAHITAGKNWAFPPNVGPVM